MCKELGIDEETLSHLPRHASSERFTALEKAALDLAVAMTATPAAVPDELRDRLLAELTSARSRSSRPRSPGRTTARA